MIRHIVMFKFKETAGGKTKRQNLEEARAHMLAMKDQIPEIVKMDVYLGAEGAPVSNYDYVLVSDFRSMEDLAAYQAHPLHVAFGQFVKELREPEGRACVDYEL